MDMFLLYLAVATLLFIIVSGIELVTGNRSIQFLKDIFPTQNFPAPKITVIIPARNEERHIEEALQSILNQDYVPMEIIVMNDRSTDRTGDILDLMQTRYPALQIHHVKDLPQGWLGKNHALNYGAQHATGELLLFTDADIVMHPSTLSRAASYFNEHRLDHLAITPDIINPGLLMEICVHAFSLCFAFFAMPWRVSNPKSDKFVGIGAFNLLRSEVYRAVGGHQAIAMCMVDDMKLGKLIKKHGFKQEMLFGSQMLHVEWYSSLGEMITGLTKNTFAGVDYKITVVIFSSLFLLLIYVWPCLGIFLTDGITQALNFTIMLSIFLVGWDAARFANLRQWSVIGLPVGILIFVYIIWKSTLTTLRNKGIYWRETYYPLAELKSNDM